MRFPPRLNVGHERIRQPQSSPTSQLLQDSERIFDEAAFSRSKNRADGAGDGQSQPVSEASARHVVNDEKLGLVQGS